jgi:anaerobic ribonucleoside-triphosphate reductase activating protein
MISVGALMRTIVDASDAVEGVTISGGEPFQQAAALDALLRAIREQTQLSILLFSGYTRIEIEGMPLGPSILALADVLIAGRYVRGLHPGRGLCGSSNQKVHYLTSRYVPADMERIPAAEVRIGAGGIVEVTGIRPPRIAPFGSAACRSAWHEPLSQ